MEKESDIVLKNIMVDTIRGLLKLSNLNPGVDGNLNGDLICWLENTTGDDIRRIMKSINIEGVEKHRTHFRISPRLRITFYDE